MKGPLLQAPGVPIEPTVRSRAYAADLRVERAGASDEDTLPPVRPPPKRGDASRRRGQAYRSGRFEPGRFGGARPLVERPASHEPTADTGAAGDDEAAGAKEPRGAMSKLAWQVTTRPS